LTRNNSDLINIKIAQRIEQGMGRSVRGEKDYSAIMIIGNDLVRFIKSSKTNKYFSAQSRKQVEIGLDIAKMTEEDFEEGTEPIRVLTNLLMQLINRDEGWKAFYKKEMDSLGEKPESNDIYDILSIEHEAEQANYNKDYEQAQIIMQKLIDEKIEDSKEKGWFLQMLARYSYQTSKIKCNEIQKSAFSCNKQLLMPKDGVSYSKLDYINENRIHRIKDWILKRTSYQDIMIEVAGIFGNLSFGIEAEKFEKALQETGEMLGFLSERPDKEYKKGPDNLWCGVNNHYFIFECKSEVGSDRNEISKKEAGQMNTHCGWFKNQYGNASVTSVLIIPTKKLSYHADFTNEIKIMRKGKLNVLKANIKSFFKELKDYKINEISDDKFQKFINMHKIDIESFKNEYLEDYIKKK